MMTSLIKAGCDVNERCPNTLQSPLLAAVSLGKLGAVKLLLDFQADVTLPDGKGLTALHMASFRPGKRKIFFSLFNVV